MRWTPCPRTTAESRTGVSPRKPGCVPPRSSDPADAAVAQLDRLSGRLQISRRRRADGAPVLLIIENEFIQPAVLAGRRQRLASRCSALPTPVGGGQVGPPPCCGEAE